MKKLILCTLCAVTAALGAQAQSQNGTMVNGEYMLEDFEGREVGESPEGLVALTPNVEYWNRSQPAHTCDWGIAEHNDSKMAWALNAYDHRLDNDVQFDGKIWSGDFALLFVTVQLPAGKSLADCSAIKLDLYNYNPDKTTDASWHKMWLNSDENLNEIVGKQFRVAEVMKEDLTNDAAINNGDVRTMTANLDKIIADNYKGWDPDENNNHNTFKILSYDPASYTGKFNIGYVTQAPRNGFFVDNLRVVPKNGDDFTTLVNNVRTESNQHIYGTRGGVRIVANGDAEIYTLDGVRVKALHIEGNELINMSAGPYIVRVGGTSCKVLVI